MGPDFFERLDREEREQQKTSHGRFHFRIQRWKNAVPYRTIKHGEWKGYKKIHKIDTLRNLCTHHFWWFVHNCIAHPMIGLVPVKTTFRFHDYTSDKINLK